MKLIATMLVTILVTPVLAATPDFLASGIRSDGVGYVNTGYMFQWNATTKTRRLVCDFFTEDGAKGTAPGPVAPENNCAIFGWQLDTKLFCRYENGTAKVWHGTGGASPAAARGENLVQIDCSTGKLTWNGTDYDIACPTSDERIALDLFAYNRNWEGAQNLGVFELRSFSIYEYVGAGEQLVHDYRPCFAEGRPGLYDEGSGTVLFPTSDGFELVGYGIDLPNGKTLAVNDKCSHPTNLTLAAGSSLVFDGRTMLTPDEVVLPVAGAVTVSLTQALGKGRYSLIGNLPQTASVSSFVVGDLPENCSGTLSISDGRLVLTLTAKTGNYPEGRAACLTGDGTGYVDTGYRYHATSYPKTAKLVVRFNTTDHAKGSLTTTPRTILGFQQGDNKFMCRYQDTLAYVWTPAGGVQPESASGDNVVMMDYLTRTVSWNGAETAQGDAAAFSTDSGYSYYLFARNTGSAVDPAAFDLQGLQFYEQTSVDGPVVLVHDYIPGVDAGRTGLYDRVTGSVIEPTGSGFSMDMKWRLSVNGEVIYASGEVTVASAEAADGWMLVRDSDAAVLASGRGATAIFEMPAAAASVRWLHDVSVSSGETYVAAGVEAVADLTLAAGATVSFSPGARIVAAGDVSLPQEGKVTVAYSGARAAGVYDVIEGLPEGVDLTAFAVGGMPEGFVGCIERHGDRLAVRLVGSVPGMEGYPDRFATFLHGTGAAAFDTGYRFRAEYPKTAMVRVDFNSSDYGRGDLASVTTPTVIGYQNDSNKFICRFSGTGGQVWLPSGNNALAPAIGDNTVIMDYLMPALTWNDAAGNNVQIPTANASATYTLFAHHNGTEAKDFASYDFRRLQIGEKQNETAETALVLDCRPCVKDGRLGLYNAVDGSYLYPASGSEGAFSVKGAEYPVEIYGGTVIQEFAPIRIEGPRPASTDPFSAVTCYSFVGDATVTLKAAVAKATVSVIGFDGVEKSRQELTSLTAGMTLGIVVGNEASATLTLEGVVSDGSFEQIFDFARTTSGAEVQYRRTAKLAGEFLVRDETEFAFSVAVSQVWADDYDAAGTKTGTTNLTQSVAAGGTLSVGLGSAAYRVIRVTEYGPGLILLFR